MNARILAHLDDADMAYRYGLGIEPLPGHIIDELRARFWLWRRHGWRLPVGRGLIVLEDCSK